jgi:hypothetical protein
MAIQNRIRSPEDYQRFRLALVPVDAAFHASEQRFGVGRLERLVSPATLAAYARGWEAYRDALDTSDADKVELVGPKMIRMLAIMESEALASGATPLAPETWEVGLPDGRIVVIVKTTAEASAVIRAANLGVDAELPPDLSRLVRHQAEGRALLVFTLAEIARLVTASDGFPKVENGKLAGMEIKPLGTPWEGAAAYSGVQLSDMAAHDEVRTGFPLNAPLRDELPKAVVLDF